MACVQLVSHAFAPLAAQSAWLVACLASLRLRVLLASCERLLVLFLARLPSEQREHAQRLVAELVCRSAAECGSGGTRAASRPDGGNVAREEARQAVEQQQEGPSGSAQQWGVPARGGGAARQHTAHTVVRGRGGGCERRNGGVSRRRAVPRRLRLNVLL